MAKAVLFITALAGSLLAVAYLLAFSDRPSAQGMTGHGWFAFILGSVFSLVVAGGLFALLFRSARSGLDEEVGRPDDDGL